MGWKLRGCLSKAVEVKLPKSSCRVEAWKISERQLPGAALCTNFWLMAAARGDWADMEAWSDGSRRMTNTAWPSAIDVSARCTTYGEAMRPNPVEAPAARPYRFLIRGMLRLAEHPGPC
jgi:hypothetical protein